MRRVENGKMAGAINSLRSWQDGNFRHDQKGKLSGRRIGPCCGRPESFNPKPIGTSRLLRWRIPLSRSSPGTRIWTWWAARCGRRFARAGGVPFEFNTIGVDDGIAMGHAGMKYSLASRELIADCVETMLRAHCFDGMVCIPNCDKIVPGMMMAAARVNIPAVFVSGGPMKAGVDPETGEVLDLNSVFVGVGAHSAGKLSDRAVDDPRTECLPVLRIVCGHVYGELHELPLRKRWDWRCPGMARSWPRTRGATPCLKRRARPSSNW